MHLEVSKALNATPETVLKRLHAMGRIHMEGIWLPHELSDNAILNRLLRLLCLSGKEKRVFYGAS